MSPRLLKCLRRIADGKSKPDFDAVLTLAEYKCVTITGSSDDLTIAITDKGRRKLQSIAQTQGRKQ